MKTFRHNTKNRICIIALGAYESRKQSGKHWPFVRLRGKESRLGQDTTPAAPAARVCRANAALCLIKDASGC